jgi:hypothetical protein
MSKYLLLATGAAALAACAEAAVDTPSRGAGAAIPPGVETLELAVGETRRLDAYRGETCDSGAPSWENVQARLPASAIIAYSDGGLSSRDSNACRKNVPTRAVDATGLRPGQEVHQFSDRIAIVVR